MTHKKKIFATYHLQTQFFATKRQHENEAPPLESAHGPRFSNFFPSGVYVYTVFEPLRLHFDFPVNVDSFWVRLHSQGL
jgi:hypothetical protein